MVESAGERRVVSAVLVDIADSTTIGEQLGPERSKFLFDEIVRLLAAEVKRFGGTVAQFTGDGLFALFGVPVAHEDDAERSVRAARAMQDFSPARVRHVCVTSGCGSTAGSSRTRRGWCRPPTTRGRSFAERRWKASGARRSPSARSTTSSCSRMADGRPSISTWTFGP